MTIPEQGLRGAHVRLEPMTTAHVAALTAAAGNDREAYPWSAVPIGTDEVRRYVSEALAARDAGTAQPLVTVRATDGEVLGSTRFFLLERWPWPAGHPRAAQRGFDGCEIGYTWLTPAAQRTAANTEAKLLMLRHAFESWDMHRVCLHTDARNERSRNAMLRIGAKFDGVLRAHRLATDLAPRDSARYSIIASEWPRVKSGLEARLAAGT
jgi:RimJ/RimL family protein N-acetyltransferase